MWVTVDRIDEGIAVLITGGREPARLTIPVSLLPEGCREGDILTITIAADPEAAEAAKGRISRRVNRLRGK